MPLSDAERIARLKHLIWVREQNCAVLQSRRIARLDDLLDIVGEGPADQSWQMGIGSIWTAT